MRFVKTALMGIGGVALVVLLLVPKAAHAVVATLVQVANTTSNPVPNADVNGPGQEAFQTVICSRVGTFYVGCSTSAFVVPASTSDGASVKRLVLTTVTGYCNQNLSTDLLGALITVSAGGTTNTYFSPLQPNPTNPGFFFSIMGPAPLYADPGSSVTALAIASGGGSAYCEYDLAGYYLTH